MFLFDFAPFSFVVFAGRQPACILRTKNARKSSQKNQQTTSYPNCLGSIIMENGGKVKQQS